MPAAKPGPDATTAARDARRLSTLLEVSQALSGTLNLKSALQRVLGTLHPSSQRRPRHGHAAARRRAARRGRRGLRGSRACHSLQARGGHHRQGRRERQADRRAAREPRAGVPQSGAAPPRAPEAGAQLHLRADHAEPSGRRRPRGRSPVQGRARLRQQHEVLRRRQLDDRAGAERATHGRGRAAPAARREHAPESGAARSATTSRTSSARAGRRGRCTSRSRRSRRPTRRC